MMRRTWIAFILLGAALVTGCSSSKEATPAPASKGMEDELRKYELTFKPADADPQPKGGARRFTGEASEPDSSSVIAPPASLEQVPGFRVQIIATASIDEANAKKAEAEAEFPTEWFYIEYDPPTYKIRAGNFINRYDADRFAKMVADRGFPDAWTVPERVYSQPPPRPSETPETK